MSLTCPVDVKENASVCISHILLKDLLCMWFHLLEHCSFSLLALVHLTMSRSVWVSRISCQRSSTDRCHDKSRWSLFCAWILTAYREHRFVPAALHFISVLPLVIQCSSRDVFLLHLSINVLKFDNHTIGVEGKKEDFQRASDNLLLYEILNDIFPRRELFPSQI